MVIKTIPPRIGLFILYSLM